MDTPRIIGLGHRKRTGKDTLAQILVPMVEARWHTRAVLRSLAWDMKMLAWNLWREYGLEHPHFYDTPEGQLFKDRPLAKIEKSPRDLWIEYGMSARRMYSEVWVEKCLRDGVEDRTLIIPDVRMPNEAEAIRRAGGILVRVYRNSMLNCDKPDEADEALAGWGGWDFHVGNNGAKDDLYPVAKQLLTAIEDRTNGNVDRTE